MDWVRALVAEPGIGVAPADARGHMASRVGLPLTTPADPQDVDCKCPLYGGLPSAAGFEVVGIGVVSQREELPDGRSGVLVDFERIYGAQHGIRGRVEVVDRGRPCLRELDVGGRYLLYLARNDLEEARSPLYSDVCAPTLPLGELTASLSLDQALGPAILTSADGEDAGLSWAIIVASVCVSLGVGALLGAALVQRRRAPA